MRPRSGEPRFKVGDVVTADRDGTLVNADQVKRGFVLGEVIAVGSREIVVELLGRDPAHPDKPARMRFPVEPQPADLLAWRELLGEAEP